MRASSPLLELTLQRVRLFWREPGAVFWTFGFPLALTVVLGIAFREQPRADVPVGLVAGEGGACPHARALAPDGRFRVATLAADEAARGLRSGRIALAVLPDCAYQFDPTRPEGRLARALVDDALQRAAGRKDVLSPREVQVSERGARYIDFLVPGLIGSNIMSSALWGIGYVLVEMRSKRLIKRLLATPMNKSHFLLSFVLLRLLFVVLELVVLLGFAGLVFEVPLRGSLWLLAGLCLLGSLAFCGLGLLCASRVQGLASINGLINLFILPMYLGSGVFFSTGRFPDWAQPFLRALPLTALNDALRAVMLDGAGAAAVAGQAALLAAVAAGSFATALRIFRWR